nr:hypothetical protein [Tanacetum cinerariifolium]
MLEENIHIILIEKLEIEEKINENLIKFQDDEKLLQLKQRMKEIFKEPEMPEYISSSSSESNDDNDDGSQLSDENEERYRKEKHSNDEYDVEIVAEETKTSKKDEANNNKEEGMANTKAKNKKIVEVQKDERNENQNIAECSEKKMNKKWGLPKKMKLITISKKGWQIKRQKINKTKEINPFDDLKFGEYYIENEHLFVPTQTSAEKKKDQTNDVDWESILENEEEIIRKGCEFFAEQRKKAQQQERE